MFCPRCKEYADFKKDETLRGHLIPRENTSEHGFLGCSRWPQCTYTQNILDDKKTKILWQQHKKRNKITRTENAPSFTEIEKW